MTRHGSLTEDDRTILTHLHAAGPLTTKELGEDLDDVGRAAYARLVRLHRLDLVDRFQADRSGPVLWAIKATRRP